MEFRTVTDIPKYGFRLGYSDIGILVGSCFADNVGQRLLQYKVPVTVNPLGAVYNPFSVLRTLERLASGQELTAAELEHADGLWFSFDCHGSFSSPDRNRTLTRINEAIRTGHEALNRASYLLLTVGTAWIYELPDGRVVANCHKLPERNFRRRLLAPEEIVTAFDPLLSGPLFKGKKVVFTVSPVRHLRDGATGNQLSKSTLIVAVHRLTEKYRDAVYFPAYEIMADDLRDYRFYERDMIHPSPVAVDYIWERFRDVLFDREARQLFARLEKLQAAREHRPLHPDTERHRRFRENMLVEIERLRKDFPQLDLDEETAYFSSPWES